MPRLWFFALRYEDGHLSVIKATGVEEQYYTALLTALNNETHKVMAFRCMDSVSDWTEITWKDSHA